MKKSIPTDITLNGRTINLGKFLPIKIKHWNQMETEIGFAMEDLGEEGVPTKERKVRMLKFTHWVLQHCDPSVTEDELGDLTYEELGDINGRIAEIQNQERERPNRPFSTRSTSSPSITGGVNPTS